MGKLNYSMKTYTKEQMLSFGEWVHKYYQGRRRPVVEYQYMLERWENQQYNRTPKKICDKCGGKIRRTYIYACPVNGLTYCEKCIDPEGRIYNDEYFRDKKNDPPPRDLDY